MQTMKTLTDSEIRGLARQHARDDAARDNAWGMEQSWHMFAYAYPEHATMPAGYCLPGPGSKDADTYCQAFRDESNACRG